MKERPPVDTHGFYQQQRWVKTRDYTRKRYNYICQRCGRRGTVVHHIQPLLAQDYIDKPFEKCYGEDNLVLLCNSCHEIVHSTKQMSDKIFFDEDGQPHEIKADNKKQLFILSNKE